MSLMKSQHGRLRFLREKYPESRRLSIPERMEKLGIDRLTVGQVAEHTRKADPHGVYNLVVRPVLEEKNGKSACSSEASAAREELFGKSMRELPGLISRDSMGGLLDLVQEIFWKNPAVMDAVNSENRRMKLEEAFFVEMGGAIRKIIFGGAVPLALAFVRDMLPPEALPYVPMAVAVSLGITFYGLRKSAARLRAIKGEIGKLDNESGG